MRGERRQELNDVKGMKKESGVMNVDQF